MGLGKLIESTVHQPGTYATGRLKKGQTLRIVDIEGEQVCDFIALTANDPTEYLNCVYTNFVLNRWKWRKGDTIYTQHMNPMWTIVDDTVGVHYTGGSFCSRDLRLKFESNDSRGCRETLEEALASHGISRLHLQDVSCFNIFMNVDYNTDGSWTIMRPRTKAGDHIDLRAEMDVLWAASVCSEFPATEKEYAVNGDRPTPLRFESYEQG